LLEGKENRVFDLQKRLIVILNGIKILSKKKDDEVLFKVTYLGITFKCVKDSKSGIFV